MWETPISYPGYVVYNISVLVWVVKGLSGSGKGDFFTLKYLKEPYIAVKKAKETVLAISWVALFIVRKASVPLVLGLK